jgi:FkbM family methyltransferase
VFNIAVLRFSTYERLRDNLGALHDIDLLRALPSAHAPELIRYLGASRSQLRQDLFVLSQLEFKRSGYFVEFGATNGVNLSNTHLLEKEFGWTGILVEPARCWHQQLRSNRSAIVDSRCVWKDSGSTLAFNESSIWELSTIGKFQSTDMHAKLRRNARTYTVASISLGDLLTEHNAPRHIDYLSIDTEGSEFDILNSLDFGRYSFQVITCEHNYTPARKRIFKLLSQSGYVRRFEALSKFDDWYVRV